MPTHSPRSPHRTRGSVLTFTVAAAVLLTTACGSSGDQDVNAGGPSGSDARRLNVVASTDVYGSIAKRIGGDQVQVTSIIDNASADPLEYEATPADARAVGSADVVVFNGNGYDEFMPRLVATSQGATSVLNVTELSGLVPSAEAAGEEFNEHVWYSLDTVQSLARTLATEMGEARPAAASAFTDRATAFAGDIGALQKQVADIAGKHKGARIAATEPLANYLLEDAGLDNVAPEEFQEAIEEGDDPSAEVLQEMLALFGEDPVSALLLNTQTQSAVTDQVVQAAQKAGVPVLRMSETLTSPSYIEWMGGQIGALAAALES